MSETQGQAPRPPDAGNRVLNARFALAEQWGTRLALATVVVTYALYVTGLLPARVPVDRLTSLVSMPVDAYLAANALPSGWAWLAQPHYGDSLALAAVLALVAVVVAAYMALVPLLWRRQDWLYLVLVVVQLAVFVLAGSGWLGGH